MARHDNVMTRERFNKMMQMREEGYSLRQIAKELGFKSSGTIAWHLKRQNPYYPGSHCGSNAGYHQHLRRKEKPCVPCYDAHAAAKRNFEKRKKERDAQPAA